MIKKFDFGNIENFDTHISSSIPNYFTIDEVLVPLSIDIIEESDVVVDLGCSTGARLNKLREIQLATYIGVDIIDMTVDPFFKFMEKTAVDALEEIDKVDIIYSIFTLQFMNERERDDTLAMIKTKIEHYDAVVFIAEKVMNDDQHRNYIIDNAYRQWKRQFFTDTEILDKDQALVGVMNPVTDSMMIDQLEYLDVPYEQIWQSFNFKMWMING